MSPRLSIRAYAKHRGCSPAAVRKAISTGRIAKAIDGSIDVAAADAAWVRNSDPARAFAARVTISSPRATPRQRTDAPSPSDDGAAEQFARARATNEQLKVRERQMALAAREASLVDRADAERLFTRMQERIAEAWRRWAPRAATELAERLAVDQDRARTAIERAVDRQLAELPLRKFDLGSRC